MNVGRLRSARLLRVLASPLVVALPPLLSVALATRRASFTPLGRDQGIFQYVAWAVAQGAVDYRDVRDVNGPLTHLVHLALLALGGSDEHRFRVLDLGITGAAFAVVGACLPGLRARVSPSALERVAWALAGWVVLSAQYLSYKYWDLAQRESFFDWFMLPSMALQLVAQAPGHASGASARRKRRLLFIAGALSIAPWFGKPTYALFTLSQLAALILDDGAERKKSLVTFAVGGAASAAVVLAFVVGLGDAMAYLRIQLADVPTMYRFIWPRTPAEILTLPWAATPVAFAFVGALVLSTLVLMREMPRRTISVALLPLCALGGVIAQAKGFPYHFHPVTAGVALQWLVLCSWVAERARVTTRRQALTRLLPLAASATLALRVATTMQDSPHARADWLLAGPSDEERKTREYFDQFPETDFFPFEMREAAAYLRAHTAVADRVQIYGMDAYLLFLARRLSATPYIYAYDLNADAALAGGSGGRPTEADAVHIRALRDAHEKDLFAALAARPPAAFVFLDGAPLLSGASAWEDFGSHCPRTADWVAAHYRETARFGHDRVWLRRDLASPEPAVGDE